MIARAEGFTLLEVLLAITVLGVIMAMLTLSLTGTLNVVDSTAQQEEIYHQAQTALRRVTEDLTAALQASEIAFTGKKVEVKSQRADTLVFASQAHLVFDQEHQKPGRGLVRYRVVADTEDERKLKLLRSDTLILPGVDYGKEENEDRPFLLADDLRSVKFRFLDQQGQNFDSWVEEKDAAGKKDARPLPAGVICTLEFWLNPDRDSFLTFTTGTLIPAAPVQVEDTGGN